MIIKEQKPIKFHNTCGCICDYEELEKAVLWHQEKPTASNKKIYMHGNYPAVSIHGEKVHIHRLLMQYWLGCKLPTIAHVHHIDENKSNCIKSNLAVIMGNSHISNHLKNKKLGKKHRAKIAEANKKRKGMKQKKTVVIPSDDLKTYLKEGYSINKIAEIYRCDWSTVKSRIEEYGIYENPELLKEE